MKINNFTGGDFRNSQNTNQPETKEVEKVKMILDVFYKKFNNGSFIRGKSF